MKKYTVEVLGTFVLTLVVGLSLFNKFPVSTPVLASLVIALFVYTVGHVSGAYFNPALIVGAWSIKKIESREMVLYILSQFVGAALALSIISFTVGVPSLFVSNNWVIIFAECIGTLFFAFGVASIIYKKTPNDLSGIIAGGSLLLGITIAVLIGSNGVLNPALALGIGSFNLGYILAPIVGAVAGMQMYKYLAV